MSEDDRRSDPIVHAATQTEPQPPPQGRLESLFREHGRLVFRAALRITGSETDAEDVVQTVFVRLLANEHVAGLDAKPAAYLRRAGTNAALDVLRRRKTARAVDVEDFNPPDERKGPDELVDNKALKQVLRQAISKLNERAAEVFTLRYIEGLSNPEIAEVIGTSAAVVAVTLHRARRALQSEIQELLGEAS